MSPGLCPVAGKRGVDTPADADSLFVLICLPIAVLPPVETTASSVQRHPMGSEQLAALGAKSRTLSEQF
jgi:hypothetical protein